jgi:hypothetical protein
VGTNPGSIARPSPLSRALRFCFPHNRIRSATSNRSISGLILPFTYVPAYTLPVYASQDVLPHHHARLGTRRLARLYRGSHLRLLNSMRFPRRNPHSPGRAVFPHPVPRLHSLPRRLKPLPVLHLFTVPRESGWLILVRPGMSGMSFLCGLRASVRSFPM